jgi:pimeloyl-ACP methyl ester carboxylesterase
MRKLKKIMAVLACFIFFPAAYAQARDLGVVMLHGKGARQPDRLTAQLVSELKAKGYTVTTPEMAWSYNRLYDISYSAALEEIDKEIQGLRAKGVKRVVLAGMSLGGNAVFAYAATHSGVDGFIVLAPGHNPDSPNFQKQLSGSVDTAKTLIAENKGDEKTRFMDVNVGRTDAVVTTPKIYLSYFDPDGLAAMKKEAAAIKTPVPFLIVFGTHDRATKVNNLDVLPELLPPHAKKKAVWVEADHMGVPGAAIKDVIDWLENL